LDSDYITEEEFDKNIKQAKLISGSISNFIKYLKQSELKGNKYRKTL